MTGKLWGQKDILPAKTMKNLVILLFLIIQVSAMAQADFTFPVQRDIENGTIEGVYDTKSGIQRFLGIPYAQPPVESLRWKAPQAMSHWEGVRQAKTFGPRSIQTPAFSDMVFRSPGMSEDCLYLNVWTPARHNTSGLPVLLYFHGGGNIAGDGSEPRYDGEQMAKKGIIVVTCNYRLGIFGFLAHPALSAEAGYHASGNYGMLDQSAAIAWVYRNIAAFGGDPKRITIAGESAGSIGVSYQMASPLSKPYLAGAIGESGAGIHPTLSPVTLAEAEQIGMEFLQKAGVASMEALRSLSTQTLYELLQETRFGRFPIVIDHYFLNKTLPEVFQAGEQAQVPLLVGWNSAELPGVVFMNGMPYSAENYQQRVKAEYPDHAPQIIKLYPDTPQEIENSATALASDRFIGYSTWKWFDLHRKNSHQPVYRYLYNQPRPPMTGATPANQPMVKGAGHSWEIEYCMNNLALNTAYAWTPDDLKVSETMSQYFAHFVKTGNPNGEKLPEWPAAKKEEAQPPVMIIEANTRFEKATQDIRYQLLDSLYKKKE